MISVIDCISTSEDNSVDYSTIVKVLFTRLNNSSSTFVNKATSNPPTAKKIVLERFKIFGIFKLSNGIFEA